ncbi:MAG: DoxX family protein [Planctomycetes bacterium]|nr:DoxX family protein [Planctomycetota bacterium]
MRYLTQHIVALVGRILISALFLGAGINHVMNWQAGIDLIVAKGLPVPHVLLALALVALFGGGLSILTGFRVRWGAIGLIVFLAVATFLFDDFWNVSESTQRFNEAMNCMKNVSLMGGLLMIVAYGAGPLSIDPFLRRTPIDGY